jgi:tetratricopeptide (TPR) repeat protein
MTRFAVSGAVLLLVAGGVFWATVTASDQLPLEGLADAESFYQRAHERADRGDFAGALRDLDEALRLRADWVEAYIDRGNVRYILGSRDRDQVQVQRAVADYNQALQRDPASAVAHYQRAAARGTLQEWTGAVEDYTAALRIDPTMDAAHLYRARYRVFLCDIPGAIADYESAAAARQSAGDEANYRRIVAALDSLRREPPPSCVGR